MTDRCTENFTHNALSQCPPLATLWIYTVVQLDLGPAVMGLVVVFTWSWFKGMKFSF